VTVFKEDGQWRIANFAWNTQPLEINKQDTSDKRPPSSKNDEDQARAAAVSALSLLHNNRLAEMCRDLISDLQKQKLLPTEASCVKAFTDIVPRWPGDASERTLLQSRPQDSAPYFFGNYKASFYYIVFHAKYPAGNIEEQVYLVKEHDEWKIAALLVKDAY